MPTDPSAPPLPTLDEAIQKLLTDFQHPNPAVKALASLQFCQQIVPLLQSGDLLLRESAQQAEPMNLRLFHDAKGRWFIRDGRLGGAGDTPEAAMRDYVRGVNTAAEHPSERMPVSKESE